VDSHLARRALADAFGERPVSSLVALETGNTKRTFAATVGGERVVVQLLPDPPGLRAETALTRALADRTDLPVATVRAAGSVDGEGYLVTDRAAGDDLHERFVGLPPAERRRLAGAFGRTLGTLHERFRFAGHGRVDADSDGSLTVVDPVDWSTWLGRLADEALAAFPDALADLREPVADALADGPPGDGPAALFPWDLRPGNARYDDGDLTLLDWGEPLTAHPGLSLAKTEYVVVDWYTPTPALREAFHDGYREATTLPADEGRRQQYYRLVAVARTAVDAHGEVTRPGYPERSPDEAAAFHREHLRSALDALR
jgi:fructosamine-3-kinase